MAAKKKRIAKKKPAKKATPKLHPLKRSVKFWHEEKVIDLICSELATSSKGLGSIILKQKQQTGDFPSYSTIMDWLDKHDTLQDKYARAKEAQADYMVDETLEISDAEPSVVVDAQGVMRIDSASVQHAKLKVDTRKWLASKLKPKKYGEKIQQVHSGQVGISQILEEINEQDAGLPNYDEPEE